MFNDSPPDPDYSDLDYCSDCRSPVFEEGPSPGCECRGKCAICGELVARETMAPAVDGSGKEWCPVCNAPDSDGVPEEVKEETSCAQTVRLKADPSIKETGVNWANKLDALTELMQPFCACGRVVSRCDGSRAGCRAQHAGAPA